jgi:hypothetical protein
MVIYRDFLVQRLHRGDFGDLEFTALYSSVYPYFFGPFLTFKLHNITSFFMKPDSVDVSSDVSDVTNILRRFIITHFSADCNRKSSRLEIAVVALQLM